MGVRIPPPLPLTLGIEAGNDAEEEGEGMGVIGRVREFVQEVMVEFRKVTWPTRQELANSTVVVIVVTVVLAFFLGAVDIVLARVVELILGGGRKGI
jgi:preprotein translocase subunit SecE